MKTYFPSIKDKNSIERTWFLVDATGKRLGRLASRISLILQGKHKPTYTPYLDMGDYVVVVNAEKVELSGDKLKKKKYYRHSGYIGGLKVTTAEELLMRKPEELIIRAVKGMLPKTSLGRRMLKKLKVYRGGEHPHRERELKELSI